MSNSSSLKSSLTVSHIFCSLFTADEVVLSQLTRFFLGREREVHGVACDEKSDVDFSRMPSDSFPASSATSFCETISSVALFSVEGDTVPPVI